MDKRGIAIIFVFIFLVAVVASAPPSSTTEGWVVRSAIPDVFMKEEGVLYDAHAHVFDSTTGNPVIEDATCVLHVYGTDGKHLFKGTDNETSNEWDYSWDIPEDNLSVGFEYPYIIQCNGTYATDDEGGFISSSFEVTSNGADHTTDRALIYIFLMLFFLGLSVMLYKTTSGADTEKWYKAVVRNYDEKNKIKTTLCGLAYNVLQEKFMLFYLLGFPVLMLFLEIYNNYNFAFFAGFVDSIITIYFVGLAIVGLLWFGKIQEFFMRIKEDIDDGKWGFNDNGK